MMAAIVNDEWVQAAMTDDSVVVELLVRLKKNKKKKNKQTHHVASSSEATLRWGIRQRRSRYTRRDAVLMRRKDGADSATNSMRASPTTPLSWSGGGSPSATADDETSRPQTFAVRSKGIAAKKSRKKKTFAELKEEEGLLVKERIHLNKEMETLRATYKIQSTQNENLKRIKLDMGLLDSGKNTSGTQVANGSASSIMSPLQQSESCAAHEAIPASNSLCMLPDLNMMPAEDDDSASETLYGMS